MPVSCCAPNCNNVPKKSHRGFYKFPFDNKELLKKWINAIDRPNWVPTRESVICSDHFLKHHFKKIKNRRHLEEFAVPTFFTSAPSEKNVNSPGSFVNKDIQNLAPVVPEIERQKRNSSAADVEDLSSFSRSYCRLCSCKGDNLISIFGEEGELFDVIEKIGRCIPMIVLPNDDLPTSICYQCLTKLNTCFLFIDSALKAETTLKKKLDKIKIQAQTNPDVSFMETDSVGIKEEVACLPTSDSTEDRRGNEKGFAFSEGLPPIINSVNGNTNDENLVKDAHILNSDDYVQDYDQYLSLSSESSQFKPLPCDVCSEVIPDLATLDSHMAKHIEKTNWKCQFCFECFDSAEDLILHKTEQHLDQIIFCSACNDSQSIVKGLESFDVKSGNFQCVLCGFCDTSYSKVYQHYILHMLRKVACVTCGLTFRSLLKYKSHRNSHLAGKAQNINPCDTCGKRILTKNLRKHKRFTCQATPRNCTQCQKSFKRNSSLQVHLRQHGKYNCKTLAPANYPCNGCEKVFEKKSGLYMHMKCHSGERRCDITCKSFRQQEELSKHKEVGQNVIKCDLCPKTYLHSSALEAHVLACHDVLEFVKYVCSTCGKSFHLQMHLREHELVHASEKLWACEKCGKSFCSKGQLSVHTKQVHETMKICIYCKESFETMKELKEHNMAKHKKFSATLHQNSEYYVQHTGPKSFSCSACAKVFTNKSSALGHLRIHCGEKSHLCTVCGRRFCSLANFCQHKLIHTKQKKHTCTTCGRQFKRKNELYIHLRNHTEEKPFSCDVCNAKFSQGRSMKIHRRRHTKEYPHVCQLCNKGFKREKLLHTHVSECH